MRNIIVTGGSRGLGLVIATRLAGAGYRVIALARSESQELRTALQASQGGNGALVFRALDLTRIDAIGPFVKALVGELGAPFGLVNNAGTAYSGVLSVMRNQEIERLVRVNTLAPIVLTKYVLRSMMSAREGRIVNLSSVVAASGSAGLAAYAATKASMIGLSRALAREVGALGITVNAVAPGFVDTDMTRELNAEQRARLARRSALRRLIEPADVAGAVAFLMSDAARNITGTTLTIDAGQTA